MPCKAASGQDTLTRPKLYGLRQRHSSPEASQEALDNSAESPLCLRQSGADHPVPGPRGALNRQSWRGCSWTGPAKCCKTGNSRLCGNDKGSMTAVVGQQRQERGV